MATKLFNDKPIRLSIAGRAGLLLTSLIILLLGGCESQSAQYNRGYENGYQSGAAASVQQRYNDGYKAGFKAARPAQRPPLPAEAIVSVGIVGLLGACKIILGLGVCVVLIVLKSRSWQGQLAVALAGALSSFSTFLILSLTYIDQAVFPILLASANIPRLLLTIIILFGGIIGYYSTKIAKSIIEGSVGIYIEVFMVILISALATVATSILIKIYFVNPDPVSYLITYLLCGFFIGGITIFIRAFMDQEHVLRKASR